METETASTDRSEERQAPPPAPRRSRPAAVKKAVKKAKKTARTSSKGPERTRKRAPIFSGGAKVGIAVPVETARLLRQYRARLEVLGGERITMAEAVEKAVRAAIKSH